MWQQLEAAAGLVYKHKEKLVVGVAAFATIAIGVAVYLSIPNTKGSLTEVEMITDASQSDGDSGRRSATVPQSSSNRPSLGQHVFRLVKLSEEFESTLDKFIPVLHLKVVSTVDIAGTINRIKQLRPGTSQKNADDNDIEEEQADVLETEEQLWDEIKVASFTLVFVSVYAVCALAVLLRTQVHLFSSYTANHSEKSSIQLSRLLDVTYSHFFNSGLQLLHDAISPIVTDRLSLWKVKEKLSLEYAELVRAMNDVRNSIEHAGMTSLLRKILITPEETLTDDDPADNFLKQLWDIIESPIFANLVTGSVGICLNRIYSQLQRQVFVSAHPMSSTESVAIPLASLLPQLRPVALRLIPKEGPHVAAVAKELVSSPPIDSFCLSLLQSVSN